MVLGLLLRPDGKRIEHVIARLYFLIEDQSLHGHMPASLWQKLLVVRSQLDAFPAGEKASVKNRQDVLRRFYDEVLQVVSRGVEQKLLGAKKQLNESDIIQAKG